MPQLVHEDENPKHHDKGEAGANELREWMEHA